MDASTAGNLAHLEEYVDTIISLPHEIQRNLTMIMEHDAQVQETEKGLFKDINEFMSIQSGKIKKENKSNEDKIELIKRIKNSFLTTLNNCEEKVSLSNQCYNSVEKHLIKMEEDLKCFEEEIRLSGYSDLLQKVRIERQRQKEQVRNKKRREAALMNEAEETEKEEEESGNEETKKELNESSSEKEQRQLNTSQPQKKRKSSTAASSRVSNAKRQAGNSRNPPQSSVKQTTTNDSDEEEGGLNNIKISRAERLLRRNKPNFVSTEVGNSLAAEGEDEDEEMENHDKDGKEDVTDNQGDDEAEDNEEEDEQEEDEQEEEEDDEGEDEDEHEEGRNVGEKGFNQTDDESEVEESREGDSDSDAEIGTAYYEEDEGISLRVPEHKKTKNLNFNNRNSLSASSASSGDDNHNRTTPRRPSKPSTNVSPSGTEPIYCICQRVSFGQMIACDGKECSIEWFHIACVGLKSLPKGKWYCRECQEIMDAKTAAQLAGGGMSTRSSRRT